jgi:hypothetical protein
MKILCAVFRAFKKENCFNELYKEAVNMCRNVSITNIIVTDRTN